MLLPGGRMRWRMLGLLAVVALGLGCPDTYGIDGSIDDAMHQDTMAQLKPKKLKDEGCPSQEELKTLCAKRDSEQCPRKCL